MSFLRRVQLTAQTDSPTFNEVYGSTTDVSALKIAFDVAGDISSEDPSSTITITNLSRDTEQQFKNIVLLPEEQRLGSRVKQVVLSAGYHGGDFGELLTSNIARLESVQKAENRETTLHLIRRQPALTPYLKSYAENQTLRLLINDIADEFGLTLEGDIYIPGKFKPKPSFQSNVKSALNCILKGTDLRWVLDTDRLILLPPFNETTSESITWNSSTGIDAPTPLDLENGRVGVEVRFRLSHKIKLGAEVTVQGDNVQGVFKVNDFRHSGDSWDGSFETICECYEVE